MKKEKMVTIDLSGHGIDYAVDVPAEMLFQLIPIVPMMIERIGVEQSLVDYRKLLGDIKSQYKLIPKICSLAEIDSDIEVFLRKCQVAAVLGGNLLDIPLMLSGNGFHDDISRLGGIDVTHQVDAGLIPAEDFFRPKDIG